MSEETGAVDPWMRHMLRGEFEAAWRVSDRVLSERAGRPCWHLPRHFQYFWDGSPLSGRRVLVRCYHGLGDTIQFIRYAPLLRRVAREVIVWAQAPLLPLLSTVGGIDRLLPLHDGSPEADYDAEVELMELPHVFRTTLRDLPATVPYINVEPVPLAREGRLAVGINWRAGDWDERRSVPFPLLAQLAELPGVRWYVFQRGPALAEVPPGFGVVPEAATLYEEARVMRSLDLMISVDTMTAHLAGALGVRAWTLLQHEADWRWMERREDSPWYPTMRLFRQPRPGDWAHVVTRVAAELKKLVPSVG
jgi:hypothetical protein